MNLFNPDLEVDIKFHEMAGVGGGGRGEGGWAGLAYWARICRFLLPSAMWQSNRTSNAESAGSAEFFFKGLSHEIFRFSFWHGWVFARVGTVVGLERKEGLNSWGEGLIIFYF